MVFFCCGSLFSISPHFLICLFSIFIISSRFFLFSIYFASSRFFLFSLLIILLFLFYSLVFFLLSFCSFLLSSPILFSSSFSSSSFSSFSFFSSSSFQFLSSSFLFLLLIRYRPFIYLAARTSCSLCNIYLQPHFPAYLALISSNTRRCLNHV